MTILRALDADVVDRLATSLGAARDGAVACSSWASAARPATRATR